MGGPNAFAKYEGLGNDFIVLELAREADLDLATVPALCDRRFGVGADGVLLVLPPDAARSAARMRVINADGSVPEMCGNGLRCVALHVARARGPGSAEVVIETDAGARLCSVRRKAPGEADVEVDMGLVRVIEQRRLELAGHGVRVALVDAGNPHAVVLGSEPEAGLDVLGPQIARHASFPRGTNVEMMERRADELHVVVWERGVGRTLACGTGACAVVAHATREGLFRSGERVQVRLPGGVLGVTHDADTGSTRLQGPARLVFRGDLASAEPPVG
jgi:diaminopimelate epimerase